MCGIAGWVDFFGDHAPLAAQVQAMTDTMAARGPDAGGLWAGRHAVLGHRRLAVTDLAGGRQPMIACRDGRDDEPSAVLSYCGEVYNYRRLREELRGRGHRFRTASDTEVVLRSYQEWGTSLASRLAGMFAFALWDVRLQRLLLVRDRLGVKPLYYHPTGRGVLFGSEPKALLTHPDVTPAVDLDGLRRLLTGIKRPGETIYRDIYEVPPGHLIEWSANGSSVSAYWRLQPREHRDDLPATTQTIRDMLTSIMTDQMAADVPVCTLLSGGLDSSALTAIAATQAGQHAEPVRSFAVDFTGHSDRFVPDRLRPAPDAPYVHALAEHAGTAHTDIVLSSSQLADPASRAAVLDAMDAPVGGSDAYTSLYLLFGAIRSHCTVAVSGEGADEVFGGYLTFHDPGLTSAPTFPWLASRSRPRSPARLLPEPLAGRLDLRGHVRGIYREALAAVPHPDSNSGDPHEHRMREITYLHLTYFLPRLLDRKDRLSMAHGLEVRVPYCDHHLVDYLFSTPWQMKSSDGREKSLLRAATRDLLPPAVANRRKSPYPRTQDPAYDQALRRELKAVAADSNAPVNAITDRQRLASLAAASTPQATQAIAFVLQFNQWLRRYQPELHDYNPPLPPVLMTGEEVSLS